MTFLATTRVAVLRGTTVDPLAEDGTRPDNSDAAKVTGLADLPASIIEKRRTVLDPATGARRTVRYTVGRIRATAALVEGDRIKDLRTGIVYNLNEWVAVPRSLAGQSSLTLDLTSA